MMLETGLSSISGQPIHKNVESGRSFVLMNTHSPKTMKLSFSRKLGRCQEKTLQHFVANGHQDAQTALSF